MDWISGGGTSWLEASLPGARAAFSSRVGGVSAPPFASLNLGLLTDDDRDSVIENRHRLAAALELLPAQVVIGHQVHGIELATHAGPQQPSCFADPTSQPPAVDGHCTTTSGLALLVFVADCLPVALAGPGGVAMLHCGWRGLAAGILARGAAAVAATHAAIGPAIGPCCYEVGEEVRSRFSPLGKGVAAGRTLDLVEVARRLLREAGVDQIEAAGICTSCEQSLLFSHRRDGAHTGRQAGLVWIEGV